MSVAHKLTYNTKWRRLAGRAVLAAGVLDDEVAARLIRAFSIVERDKFLLIQGIGRAGDDISLPIGFEQFSGKPSLLARLFSLLRIEEGMKILHIGSGSGYASAVMSECGAYVYAVEQIGLLAQQSRKQLDALGYSKVLVRCGEGEKGWEEHGPYDAIVVTTPLASVPPELVKQLKHPFGRLACLIGDEEEQSLELVEATPGGIRASCLESGRFL
jgi:protein-L-isoaspartate(D-aspartate) O-methyltransferase